MKNDSYLDLEQSVVSWCQRRPDILAVVVIGSRGSQAPTADAHSDLDLILFSQEAGSYEERDAWLNDFGEVWIAALNYVGPGDPEWMACFSPGLKADFLFVAASADQSLADMLAALPYQQVLTRGFRLLYQADAVSFEPVDTSARQTALVLPSEWQFQQKVNATLFTAERFVKFSIRNDIWRSQYTYDGELKNHLLAFIEWHAQTAPGDAGDTWYEGRNLETWADKRVLKTLPNLHPGHAPGQQQAALLSYLDLLVLLAGETAARLGYEFPSSGQRKMIAWLKTTVAGATG